MKTESERLVVVALAVLAGLAIVLISGSGTVAATPGLVAAYAFDEGSGSVVSDLSGNGNNGTVSNTSWVTGKYGGALSFNGSSSRVTIPDSASLHLAAAITLEAWVNPAATTSTWKDVIYKGNDNYYLEGTSPVGGRPVGGGTFGDTFATSSMTVNSWTHLAVTYDKTMIRLYVNGTQVSSLAATAAIATSTNPLTIGSDPIWGQYFSGLIDDVRVYNSALTQTQIQTDMTTPVAPPGPDTTPPSAPGTLTATAISTNRIDLNWGPASDNIAVTGYHIERCQGNGCTTYTEIATTPTTTYSDTTTNPATSYSYRIRANDATNNLGPYTNTATATTPNPDTTPPSTPTGLATSGVSQTSVLLSWNASSDNVGVTGYQVYLGATQVGTSTSTSYLYFSGLACGTTYTLGVAAVDAAGNVSAIATISQQTSACTDTTPPSAPGTLTATAISTNRIDLNWGPASDNIAVTGYHIERCQGNGCTTYTEIATTPTTTYSDTTTNPATSYSYRIRANDATNNLGPYTNTATATTPNPDTTPPSTPTGLATSGVSQTSVLLSWNASSDNVGVTGYQVYLGATQVGTSTSTSYLYFSGLACGTTYTLGVAAVDAAGNVSAIATISQQTSACTDTTPPSAPGTLTATAISTNRIDLNWGPASDNIAVTGYHIERCQGNGCTTYTEIATTPTTTYSDTTTNPATSYSYRIRANDATNNLGPYTNTATATTPGSGGPRPVAAYAFDEGSGSVVSDLSGNGNNGTVSNTSWVTGKYGGALSFNGSSSRVTIPDSASLHLAAAITLEAWVNPAATTSTWKDVIYKGNDNYYLEGTSPVGGRPVGGGTFGDTFATSSMTVNSWTHLAVTYDKTMIRLYVNGTQVSSLAATAAIATSTNPLTIGSDPIWGQYFSGLIDDVRVYNSALTQTQIQTDMTTPVAPPGPDTTPPSAPGTLTATAISTNRIDLNWGPASDNIAVTGYHIERCQGNGCTTYTEIATTPTTTYSDTTTNPATSYSYRIRANDATNNLGPYTNTATATTPNPDTTPPSTPTGLATSGVSQTSVLLSWNASSDNVGVTGYQVYLGATQVGTSTSTSYLYFSGLACGTTYTLGVAAVDAAGNVSAIATISQQTSACTDTTPPSAPGTLTATAISTNRIDLNWGPASDNIAVTGYHIERCQGNGCTTYTEIATTPTTTYSDTTTNPATSYSYRIRANDATNNLGPYTNTATATTPNPDTTPPSTPTGLATSGVSQTSVLLSWNASSDNVGVTGYQVYLGATQVGTSTSTSYLYFSGLACGTTYTLGVAAVDAAGNVSAIATISQQTSACTDTTPPSAPGTLTATAISTNRIDLNWGPASDNIAVTGYHIERCQGNGCTTYTEIATTPTTTYSDTTTNPATSYSYRIRANDATNNLGPYTNTATATTPGSGGPRPVAAYAFDEGSGSVVSDLSGNGNNGTVSNTSWVTGKYGGALSFNGSSSRVTIPDSASLHLAAAITLEAWVNPAATTSTWKDVIYKGNDNYYLEGTSPVGGRPVGGGTFGDTFATSSMTVNSWTHLAVTYDKTMIRLYVNGTQVSSLAATAAIATSTNPLTIGSDPIWGQYFSGLIDDVRVYNSALTQTQIQTDMTTPVAPPGPDTTPPSAPGTLTATAISTNRIDLNWGPASDNIAVTGYHIERCQGNGCTTYTEIATTPTTTYSDTTTNPATSYSYRIRANDATNNLGPYTNTATATTPNPDTTPPSTPTGLATSGVSQTSVLLSWNASSDNVGVTGYQVYLGATQVGTSTSTSYLYFSGLACGTTYTLGVAAVDAAGNVSAIATISQQTSACTDTTPPSAPGTLTATAISTNRIDLNWGPASDNIAVTGYHIERCQGNGCTTYTEIATTPTTTYSDTTTNPATSYSYRIRANDATNNLGPYTNTATATTPGSGGGLVVSPRAFAVTPGQTVQYTASVSGSVTWSVDGVAGGSAPTGTITSGGLYTAPGSAGVHTITATAGSQSGNATAYTTDYAGTFTFHNDNMRDGANLNETVLTPSNVNTTTFGKLFSYPLDGLTFASPLYVENLTIPSQGAHNVVFVVTEHDSVFAFDADGRTSTPLWHDSFINPGAGITPVPPADTGEPDDIPNEIGITGTPVIDPATSTLYLVAKTKEVSGSTTSYVHRLHALDLATGAEKFGGPVVISAQVSGTGVDAQGGKITFNDIKENQRPGLLLVNGEVYVAFGNHGFNPPYHGWLMAYNASTLHQDWVFCTTPNAQSGGIWMGGDGVPADSAGSLYFSTGNGTFNTSSNYGDSVVKLSPSGTVSDYFTPYNYAALDSGDIDLGSGGLVLLPDQSGAHAHELIAGGKGGTLYVVDRDNMGHVGSTSDSQIVQSLISIFPTGGSYNTGNYSAPTYYNGSVYYAPVRGRVMAFSVTNGRLSTAPTSQSSQVYDGRTSTFSARGGETAVSANGGTNGILWALQSNGDTVPGTLHAYDASNLANEYYTSDQAASRDALDPWLKFTIPVVANGRVYVASAGQLTAYGLLP